MDKGSCFLTPTEEFIYARELGGNHQSGYLWRHCFLEVCDSIPKVIHVAIILVESLNWELILWTIRKEAKFEPRTVDQAFIELKELGVEKFGDFTRLGSFWYQRLLSEPGTSTFELAVGSCQKARCSWASSTSGELGSITSQTKNQIIIAIIGRRAPFWCHSSWNRQDLVHTKSIPPNLVALC